MKKLLTLALLTVAGIASAANINWGATYIRNTYVWDKDGNKFNGTAYLVLADDVSTIISPTETQDFQSLLNANKLDSATISDGKYGVDETVVESDKLTAGQSYDFQLIFVDSNGNYQLSGTDNKQAYTPGDDERMTSFTSTLIGATRNAPDNPASAWTDKPVYGGGGQGGGEQIPEPATGALALAGIALLFKRRRA